MKVLVRGVVIGKGSNVLPDGVTLFWLKLYQAAGEDRPGETAELWSKLDLGVDVGQLALFDASARAEGDRLRIQRVEVVRIAPEGAGDQWPFSS